MACVMVLTREGKDGLRQAADPEDLVAGHQQVLGQHRPAELGVGQVQGRQGSVGGEKGGVDDFSMVVADSCESQLLVCCNNPAVTWCCSRNMAGKAVDIEHGVQGRDLP